MLTIMMEIPKEALRNDAKQIQQERLKGLKEKENKTDFDLYMIDFIANELERNRTPEEILRDNYYKIIDTIDYYLDIKPEYQNLAALWIIGTYLHKQFDSYPFLFINAMRGSGKSRLLRLITKLSQGKMTNSLTEAVLFRTKNMLAIDEFEGIGQKEKTALRELLNSAYKKGTTVQRMRERKIFGEKKMVVDEFEVYRPIVMANIWGMDEVLGDRCISLQLEKSADPSKTMIMEAFDTDEIIKMILAQFDWCSLCSVVSSQNIYTTWNSFIKDKYINSTNIHYIHNIHTLQTTLNNTNNNQTTIEQLKVIDLESFFAKVMDAGISGRNLEIFMPLFMVAKIIGEDILTFTIRTAGEIISERRQEEQTESKDVMLFDFVSKLDSGINYYPISQLTKDFRFFTESCEEWINERWIGRALKRLSLVVSKRRQSHGIEIIVNVAKAKEKIKMFKGDEEKKDAN